MAIFTAAFLAVSAAAAIAASVQKSRAAQASASATKRAGASQRQAAEFAATIAGRRADALDIRAGQERAAGQRAAIEQRRQGRFVESRARALAAGSGAGASDPTIVNILGDIGAETEIRALDRLFQGEEAARGSEVSAEFERARGRGELFAGQVEESLARERAGLQRFSARSELITGTIGTLADTGSSLYEKYSRRKPVE